MLGGSQQQSLHKVLLQSKKMHQASVDALKPSLTEWSSDWHLNLNLQFAWHCACKRNQMGKIYKLSIACKSNCRYPSLQMKKLAPAAAKLPACEERTQSCKIHESCRESVQYTQNILPPSESLGWVMMTDAHYKHIPRQKGL